MLEAELVVGVVDCVVLMVDIVVLLVSVLDGELLLINRGVDRV